MQDNICTNKNKIFIVKIGIFSNYNSYAKI